jgi:hypothetical protein
MDIMPRYRSSTPRGPRNPNKQLISAIVLVITLAIAAYKNYEKTHPPTPPVPTGSSAATTSSHWLLGNHSNAGSDPNNFLLIKPYFVVSYNNQKGTPNWVSWRLTKDDLGDAPRRNKFSTDTTLPSFFNLVSHRPFKIGLDPRRRRQRIVNLAAFSAPDLIENHLCKADARRANLALHVPFRQQFTQLVPVAVFHIAKDQLKPFLQEF